MDYTTDFSTVSLPDLLRMRDIIGEICDINDRDICIARGHNWTGILDNLLPIRSYYRHLRQQIQLQIDTLVLEIETRDGDNPQLDLTVQFDKL